jgi:hypothetical protein
MWTVYGDTHAVKHRIGIDGIVNALHLTNDVM